MIERAKLGNNCRVLLRTIVARHKWSFLGAMLLQTIATGLTFVNVVLLNQLLGYMQSVFTGKPGISETSAYVIVAMMFVNPMINSLLVSHSNRFALGAQVRIRADLASALYRKALRLSSEYVIFVVLLWCFCGAFCVAFCGAVCIAVCIAVCCCVHCCVCC